MRSSFLLSYSRVSWKSVSIISNHYFSLIYYFLAFSLEICSKNWHAKVLNNVHSKIETYFYCRNFLNSLDYSATKFNDLGFIKLSLSGIRCIFKFLEYTTTTKIKMQYKTPKMLHFHQNLIDECGCTIADIKCAPKTTGNYNTQIWICNGLWISEKFKLYFRLFLRNCND